MRNSKAGGSCLLASAAVAVLAGCSSGNLQLAPTAFGQRTVVAQKSLVYNRALARTLALSPDRRITSRSFMSPDAVGKPLVFVSVWSGSRP